jgi:DNA polymerase-1
MLISADYSQIEMRLLAELADVAPLKAAFTHQQDIHAITASQIFGVPVEAVTEMQRRRAKGINFGIIYGISPFGLARNIGITRQDAELYIAKYFEQYPGIKEYMDQTIEFARTHGFVQSMFGRRCNVHGINDKNAAVRSFAERAAINAPLQSTASDIIRKAMVMMPQAARQYMVLQIHDELLFDVPSAEVQSVSQIIKYCMEGVVCYSVPMVVSVSANIFWF